MIRPLCPGCGVEVSYPCLVDGVPHCYTCARGFDRAKVPTWLSRSKDRSISPRGLAKALDR